MSDNRQFILDAIPQGKLSVEHFRLAEAERPTAGEGEVLVRARYISLDAANRAWMQGATYRSALEQGQVMAGGALAEVIESKAPGFAPGELVFAETGWQEWAVLPAKALAKAPALTPASHLLSVYGVTGLTAYLGLLRCGDPKPGETVVVSAAAGAVGSMVGQIAKLKGARPRRRACRSFSTTSAAMCSKRCCSTWPTMAASSVAERSRNMTARRRRTDRAASQV